MHEGQISLQVKSSSGSMVITLPEPIDEESAVAKFSKKTSNLTITMQAQVAPGSDGA